MSTFDSKRTVDPFFLSAAVSFEDAELRAALAQVEGPEPERLFFEVFSPEWETKSLAEKLRLLAEVADLVPAPASALGLATTTEPREGG